MMKKNDFLVQLVRACLHDNCEEEAVLACMIVLHTNCLKVQNHVVLDDADNTGVLSPLTRRHVSEIVAEALMGLTHSDNSEYWYTKYDATTPFEVAGDVPNSWKSHTDAIEAKMKSAFLSDIWPD
jgi:hypothetical protein